MRHCEVVLAQTPSFWHYDIFCFQAQSLFKHAAVCLSCLPCKVTHSKQAAVMFSFPFYFPAAFSLPSSMRSESFLIPFFISLLYLMPLFPINKHFSIDSFLHHWDSLSSCSSNHHMQFPHSVILLPTHLTR